MKTLKETKILGFPLWMFLILAALMMVMAANDWMLTNMVGALAFAMVVGTLLGWVGDHIPVWKTWFGDVQCLGAAHRMELMSYAQISSRIGGAIMLVVASFFFGKFL